MSRPIHEVKPLQARLVRSWETRLEVRVLSVLVYVTLRSRASSVVFFGGLAQTAERCVRNAEVAGSIPASSTARSHVVQVVRIVGFHPIDPGSSPGVGEVRVKEATIWPSG